jgi:hypothetical protein
VSPCVPMRAQLEENRDRVAGLRKRLDGRPDAPGIAWAASIWVPYPGSTPSSILSLVTSPR